MTLVELVSDGARRMLAETLEVAVHLLTDCVPGDIVKPPHGIR